MTCRLQIIGASTINAGKAAIRLQTADPSVLGFSGFLAEVGDFVDFLSINR